MLSCLSFYEKIICFCIMLCLIEIQLKFWVYVNLGPCTLLVCPMSIVWPWWINDSLTEQMNEGEDVCQNTGRKQIRDQCHTLDRSHKSRRSVFSLTCFPLCVTDCKIVRSVLKPTATSSKWAAKKKLLKFPRMENMKYHKL